MGFIKADRFQQNFIGYCIDDFAKSDQKSRFVVHIVSRLNTDSFFARYSDQGGDAYAPDVMLVLWFYAYSEGITSSRKLEELCWYDTRYIYLSCNLRPDHTTLSRFRQHNLDLLVDYFVQIVLIAEKEGLSGFKRISIDGSKIKAVCSAKQSYRADQLSNKIEAIREDIRQYMARCLLSEEGTADDLDLETLRTEKARLEELEKKLVERQQQLQERQKTLKAEHRRNHQINIVEPDARFMPKSDGPNYNVQTCVDSETNLIVNNDVTDEPNDQNQFEIMHKRTESTISADPARQYTADSGFHSLKQLEYIDNNRIDAIIAEPTPEHRSVNTKRPTIDSILREQRKVKRSDFVYHVDKDYYECPNGDNLLPIGKGKKRDITIYQAQNCGACPLANLCVSNKAKLKRIYRNRLEYLAEQMYGKMQTDEAKSRMKIRATTVEPVFGNLKQNLGFRRFHLRGLQKVRGEFNLMCIAHNLNVLFKLIYRQGIAPVSSDLLIEIRSLYRFLLQLRVTTFDHILKIGKYIICLRDYSNYVLLF